MYQEQLMQENQLEQSQENTRDQSQENLQEESQENQTMNQISYSSLYLDQILRFCNFLEDQQNQAEQSEEASLLSQGRGSNSRIRNPLAKLLRDHNKKIFYLKNKSQIKKLFTKNSVKMLIIDQTNFNNEDWNQFIEKFQKNTNQNKCLTHLLLLRNNIQTIAPKQWDILIEDTPIHQILFLYCGLDLQSIERALYFSKQSQKRKVSIKFLRIKINQYKADELQKIFIQYLDQLQNLYSLNLSNNQLSNDDFSQLLKHLIHYSNLRSVNLFENEITNINAKLLKKFHFQRLQLQWKHDKKYHKINFMMDVSKITDIEQIKVYQNFWLAKLFAITNSFNSFNTFFQKQFLIILNKQLTKIAKGEPLIKEQIQIAIQSLKKAIKVSTEMQSENCRMKQERFQKQLYQRITCSIYETFQELVEQILIDEQNNYYYFAFAKEINQFFNLVNSEILKNYKQFHLSIQRLNFTSLRKISLTDTSQTMAIDDKKVKIVLENIQFFGYLQFVDLSNNLITEITFEDLQKLEDYRSKRNQINNQLKVLEVNLLKNYKLTQFSRKIIQDYKNSLYKENILEIKIQRYHKIQHPLKKFLYQLLINVTKGCNKSIIDKQITIANDILKQQKNNQEKVNEREKQLNKKQFSKRFFIRIQKTFQELIRQILSNKINDYYYFPFAKLIDNFFKKINQQIMGSTDKQLSLNISRLKFTSLSQINLTDPRKNMIIDDNKLKIVLQSIKFFKNIEYIDLSNNSITQIAFKDLENLGNYRQEKNRINKEDKTLRINLQRNERLKDYSRREIAKYRKDAYQQNNNLLAIQIEYSQQWVYGDNFQKQKHLKQINMQEFDVRDQITVFQQRINYLNYDGDDFNDQSMDGDQQRIFNQSSSSDQFVKLNNSSYVNQTTRAFTSFLSQSHLSLQELNNQIISFKTNLQTSPSDLIFKDQKIKNLTSQIDKNKSTSSILNAYGDSFKNKNQIIHEHFKRDTFKSYYQIAVNFEVLLNQQFNQILFKLKQQQQTLKKSKTPNLKQGALQFESAIQKPERFLFTALDRRDFEYKPNNQGLYIFEFVKYSNFLVSKSSPSLIKLIVKAQDLLQLAQTIYQAFLNQYQNFLKSETKQIRQYNQSSQQIQKLINKLINYFTLQTKQILNLFSKYIYNNMVIYFKDKKPKCIENETIKYFKQLVCNFMEKICLYNYFVTLNEFTNQNQFDFVEYYNKVIVLNLNNFSTDNKNEQKEPLKILPKSKSELKIQLLQKILQDPERLKRLFKDNYLKDQQRKKYQLSLSSIFKSCPINQQYQKALEYSKYAVHYYQFCHQIVAELAEQKNKALENVQQSFKFILIFLILNFSLQTIKRIQKQIQFRSGRIVFNLYQEAKNKDKKWIENRQKAKELQNFAYKILMKYIESTKNPSKQQSSSNLKKKKINLQQQKKLQQQNNLQQQKCQLFEFIKSLHNNSPNDPSLEWNKIRYIFEKIIQLFLTQCLSEKIIEKSFRKLTISIFGEKWKVKFNSFIQGEYGKQLQQISNIKEKVEKFQKQFKIIIIQNIKLFSVMSTMIFYSFETERFNIRTKNLKKINQNAQRQEPKDFYSLAKSVALFQIYKAEELNSKFLNDRSVKQLNDILQKCTKYASFISQFILCQNNNLSNTDVGVSGQFNKKKKKNDRFQKDHTMVKKIEIKVSGIGQIGESIRKLSHLLSQSQSIFTINRQIHPNRKCIFPNKNMNQLIQIMKKSFHEKSLAHYEFLLKLLSIQYKSIDEKKQIKVISDKLTNDIVTDKQQTSYNQKINKGSQYDPSCNQTLIGLGQGQIKTNIYLSRDEGQSEIEKNGKDYQQCLN